MTIMAVGNEVYLSSSQRGASSFTYNYAETPLRYWLRICELVWRQRGLPDGEHWNDGKCGEVMVTHQYYVNHPQAAQALVL
jgi:hypothetical protein